MKTKIKDGKIIGDWTGLGNTKPTKKQIKEYEKAIGPNKNSHKDIILKALFKLLDKSFKKTKLK